MDTLTSIPITRTEYSRLAEYDFSKIVFGVDPTDHMFTATYRNGSWQDPCIVPFRDLTISPIALCLHYGQTVFEGLKAYRTVDGNINVFRPHRHHARLNKSLERMSMPPVPESLFIDAIHHLVELEQHWVPAEPGTSLYLRPLVIATEPRLGVKVSDEYRFIIVAMPMADYYTTNLKVKVETTFSRAAEGGTGAAKCGGNYGAAFYPTQQANDQGFDQVLWTDGTYHEFIEESGTMNIMFILDGVLVTPPLGGSILDGVTRDSLLTLAKADGIPVEERKISYNTLEDAFRSGKTVEAFGVGTAAMVSPIEAIDIRGNTYYPNAAPGAWMYRLKNELQAIHTGNKKDAYHWNYIIQTTPER